MKVKLYVGTNVHGSKIEQTIELQDGDTFDDDDFEQWVWEHIDSGYEILEDTE